MRTISLAGLLAREQIATVVGAHDGLSARIAEAAGADALWVSGLAVSTSYGVPDAGLLTMTEMHAAAVQMRRATSLPIIADVDCGFGDINVIRRMISLYEDSGIDAVCIEDKQYPKRNSFRDGHRLESPQTFARRIAYAKAAQRSDSFMVVARHESLIAGAGMDDAIARARIYRDAGADVLLIHSRLPSPVEVAEYCARWREIGGDRPVIAIPTTYYETTAQELQSMGVAAAIYANHLLRSSIQAMEDCLRSLMRHGTSAPIEPQIASLARVFALTGTEHLINDDCAEEFHDAQLVGNP